MEQPASIGRGRCGASNHVSDDCCYNLAWPPGTQTKDVPSACSLLQAHTIDRGTADAIDFGKMVGRLAIGQALAGLGTLHVVEPELGADLHAPPLKQVRRVGTGTRLQLVDSISAAHRAAGLELDTKAREIRAAMKGNRKTYSTPQAQAEALKPAIVRGILATLGDSPLERHDAALAALLF